MNKTIFFISLLIIICCLFSGCGNVFNLPAKGSADAVPEDGGYGKVIIRFAGEEGRTAFPAKGFLEYVYTFTRYDALDGGNEIESLVLEPGAGGVFTVDAGFWAVDVKAYAGEIKEDKLAAAGSSERTYVGTGPAEIITITLEEKTPADTDSGTFSYAIVFPENTVIAAFTLKRLPYLLDEIALSPATISGLGGIAEALDVPAGFYLLTVQLERFGKYTGTNEVIHIYPNLETGYAASFAVADFLDTTITISAINGVTPPAYGEKPAAAITGTDQFTGTVEWYVGATPFAGTTFGLSTAYTAVITLTGINGCTAAGTAADFFIVAGASAVTSPANSGRITATFPPTQAVPPAVVSRNDIPGIAVPVVGDAPLSGELVNSTQYAGTVEWSPAHPAFQAGTSYTATITLTAKTGYTFTGVAADFFIVEWASAASNGANSGIVTAEFTSAIVAFKANGGNPVDPVDTFVAYRIPRPEYPVLGEKYDLGDSVYSDFTFAGWFYDDELTSPVTFPSAQHDRYDTVPSDITLFAKWLPGEWKMIDGDPDSLAGMFNVVDDGEGNLIQDPDDLDGDYFLTDDVSLDEYFWIPIGTSEANPFTGTFDGNGRKIICLWTKESEDDCVGLFGAINSAVIRNLGVEIGGNGILGNVDVGGITGNAKNSLIENCYVKGNISASGSVGGIAGHIGSNSIVRNCYTVGSVESLTSDAGGIVGNMKDGGIIENCYSTMAVRAATDAGGIVALIQDRFPHDGYPDAMPPAGMKVINCAAINQLVISTGLSPYAGRVVGKIEIGPREGPFELYSMASNSPAPRQEIIIHNNYSLSTLPQASPAGHNDAERRGNGYSDGYFRQKSSYEGFGWAFDPDEGPWKMPAGGGYPILYWEQD